MQFYIKILMSKKVAIVQQQQTVQDVKSLLVKYYESKRVIPHLISQANQAQLTLDKSFISLKLMDDDQNNKDLSITVEKLLEQSQGGQKKPLGMVIKGGPGSGKSTLLDKIAYTWAKDVNSNNKKVEFDYVFRIDLKKIDNSKVKKQQSFSKLIFYSLIQAFQQRQSKNTNKQERQKKLRDQLSSILSRGKFYKFMFLLDGYDQVKHFQGDQSLSQSNCLAKIFQNVKNYNTIITSRPQATQGSKSLEDFKRIIEIQPLDETSINNFIDIMFQKNQDCVKREDLKRQIKINKNVMKIIQSPLNLTMVCLIFINQTEITKHIDLQLINEIFLYDKIIKLITLRQENKGYANDLDRQDLQKTVSEGNVYQQIEPLNLLKETVYTVFKTGNLVIKKEDIGKSSNKKYDEKRKAIRRTIDFGLLKKKNEYKGKDPKKPQQDEQYTFIHLSFAEYLFAYSIFEKLKNYIPSNRKNQTKTSIQQLQEITSFIANNRYKTSYLNSFRHLTMLCYKYYNQQMERYQKQTLTKSKKIAQKINSTNKDKEDYSRFFKFPLQTIWICFVCNIDGVIEFGKQQRLKLIIQMVGLSSCNHLSNHPTQSSKIQILSIVKNQFIEPYFKLNDPNTKQANKRAIVRWHKYFINSNYFPSKLTQQLIKQIENYLHEKEGLIKVKILSKLDEDFIVAFCEIISCAINSKMNNYFHKKDQNKLQILKYFLKLLQNASAKHEKISLAVLSNIQNIFHSLQQTEVINILFQYNKEGEKYFDLISILLQHLGNKQLNDITFKLLCYFVKKQQQIKQKYIKSVQQQKKNLKNSKLQLVSGNKSLQTEKKNAPSKIQKPPIISEQIIKLIKKSSIKKRILQGLKQELTNVLKINLDKRGLQQSKIFQQLTSEKLKPSEPTQAKECWAILMDIKMSYIQDVKTKLLKKQSDNLKIQVSKLNNLIKQKMYIFFKYYKDQQRKSQLMRDIILKLDMKNSECQIISAAEQTNNELVKKILYDISLLLSRPQQQQKYFSSLKQYYLNRNIVNGYGHFIKGNILIVYLSKFLLNMKKSGEIPIEQAVISIVFNMFQKILKYKQKEQIIKEVDLIVNYYMNQSLGYKLFQNNFQKGVVSIFHFFKESFSYIGKKQIKKQLQKILLSLQSLAIAAPKYSTVIRMKSYGMVNENTVQHVYTGNSQLDEFLKRQKKQTKQSALISIIDFLEQTISYNNEEDIMKIIKNIIMPLCTFFNVQRDFFYENSVKISAMSFIKSTFKMIKSQNLLTFLKQLSMTLYDEKKNEPQPKQKILDKKEVSKQEKSRKKKQKDVVKEDKQYIALQILGAGIVILKQKQKTLLLQSQLFLFQDSSKKYLYQVGSMLMNNQLYQLSEQNQQYFHSIFFHLLNKLADKESKSSPKIIINFLTDYLPYINNTKITSQLLEQLIDILSNKQQLFQSALRLLIQGVPYLKDHDVRLTIIKSVIPLAAKKKKTRKRTYQFLMSLLKVPYDNDDAISTLYQTANILEKKLHEPNIRSKINSILIFKEILPLLAYFDNNSLIQKVINAIAPMIEDYNIQLTKHAISFMGFAISIIKQRSTYYFDKTFGTIFQLLESESKEIRFSSIRYMKKVLPKISENKFMQVFAKVVRYFEQIQDFSKCSNQENQEFYKENQKTLYNMAFNFFSACLIYIDQKILYALYQQMIEDQDQKKRKIYQKIVKAINDRAHELSLQIAQCIFGQAEIVVTNKNQTLQVRILTIGMIKNIIDPSIPDHKKIAEGSLSFIQNILSYEEKGIQLQLISLMEKISACLNKEDKQNVFKLMIQLLSDKDDDVRAAALEYIIDKAIITVQNELRQSIVQYLLCRMLDDNLRIKQTAFDCILNFLPSPTQVKDYRQTVNKVIMLIKQLIKNMMQEVQEKLNQSNKKEAQNIKNNQIAQILREAIQIQIQRQDNHVNQNKKEKKKKLKKLDEGVNFTTLEKEKRKEQKKRKNQYYLYLSIINFIQHVFISQKNLQLQYQLLQAVIFPAFSYEQNFFPQISLIFIHKIIEQKKIQPQKIFEFIVTYLQNCTQRDPSLLIMSIGDNFCYYQSQIASKTIIKQMVPFLNKFDQNTHANIQQLIKSASLNLSPTTLYNHVLGRQFSNNNRLAYDKIYFLKIVMEKATDKQAQRIALRIVGQSNDNNINIRQKVRNIIEIAIPKIAQNKRVDLIKPVLQDIINKSKQQKIQMLIFLANCIKYLNSKIPEYYLKTFQALLDDQSNQVKTAAIKFMEKSLQQCIKKPQQRQPLTQKLLPLFSKKKLGFENSVNFVQMIHLHLNEKDKQELLSKLKPFFEGINKDQFLKRVKSVKNILSQLDSSIQTIILNIAISFLLQEKKFFRMAIEILHTIIPVFKSSLKLSFQVLVKLIPHLKHQDELIQKQVKEIVKMGISYQQQSNRALLMLNIMILYSQDKNEKDLNNVIDYSKIQFGSSITIPVDKLMKMKSLEFELDLLYQQSNLMDTIHVAIKQSKPQNVIITLFGKILSIKGVLERQSAEIVKLINQYPSLNGTIADKIKNSPQDFKGHNFTILIEFSKTNNYIYGVISQLYVQILDETQKDIIKQGADSKILQSLSLKIKNKEIDCQSFFTQQLLKRIVMLRLSDKQLSQQDSTLLKICIQCDLTISFRYHYDENKEDFENKYEDHYFIDMGDRRFPIKQGCQNIFAILRTLFGTNQGSQYAKHNNKFINNEKNGLKKAAIDISSCKDIFLDHKKIVSKLFKDKKRQQQILSIDWNRINILHFTYQQSTGQQEIYFIVKRDQFGNITVRKFQNLKKEQPIKDNRSHRNYSDLHSQRPYGQYTLAIYKEIKKQINIKKEKCYKDYILHLNQFNHFIKAFKNQLFGQKDGDDRRNIYTVQCYKISLENYKTSYDWSIKQLKQFLRKIPAQSKNRTFQGKFPKWVLLGQRIKPYQLTVQDIQNVEQILQITGITAKSKLKKALKKLGKTTKEKELLAQYIKVAYWKLTNMVQSYGLVDCGILKKDDQFRTKDDQSSKEENFISAVDFFGDTIESLPIFGSIAKICVDYLSNKAKENISRKQQNQKTAFLQLFQDSSANIEERNLLIDEIILQLTKKRMMVLFSQQKQDKIPILFNVIDGLKQIKENFDNLFLQEQLKTQLERKRTSIMAKMDIATLAMAIMSKQSQIIEEAPERSQIPSLLMKYLDEKIKQDEKQKATGFMARIKKCLFVYENCFRRKSNVEYQYRELTCSQRVKKYLGACLFCCERKQEETQDQIRYNMYQQSIYSTKFNEMKESRNSRLDQSIGSMSYFRKQQQ